MAAHDYYTLLTQSLGSEMDNKDEELLFVMLCGLRRAALFMFSERKLYSAVMANTSYVTPMKLQTRLA